MTSEPAPLTPYDDVPPLPTRTADAHKGQLGHVLCLAGSSNYTGAAVLAARAALRGGAGLVTLGCPDVIHTAIASQLLCEISYALPGASPGVFARDAVSEALDLADRSTSVALGPGLTREHDASAFARDIGLLCPVPTVIDADGINAFADAADDLARASGPRVLTPHPGEAARVLGWETVSVVERREAAVRELAQRSHAIVLLKGAGTLVTDGERLYRNTTGNAGMATAGSGDVLTGLVAALLAQGMPGFEATVLGAYLHGVAGDLAAAALGQYGMTAADILDRLPLALKGHTTQARG
jgi:NAD(P)H-hydrate epimerase